MATARKPARKPTASTVARISPAYVFLAAPACASYITGVVLPIMGGPGG
jgi:hypothetical protein